MTHYALVQSSAVIDTRNVAVGQSPPPAPVGCQWVADPSGLVAPGWSWTQSGGFLAPAAPAPSAEQICAQIDRLRDTRLAAGFVDTGNTGKTYQCDVVSVARWDGLAASCGFAVVMNVSPQPTVTVRCADNSEIQLTANQAFVLFNQRVAPWVSATILYAGGMKDNVRAGQPPNSQNDITQGWP